MTIATPLDDIKKLFRNALSDSEYNEGFLNFMVKIFLEDVNNQWLKKSPDAAALKKEIDLAKTHEGLVIGVLNALNKKLPPCDVRINLIKALLKVENVALPQETEDYEDEYEKIYEKYYQMQNAKVDNTPKPQMK